MRWIASGFCMAPTAVVAPFWLGVTQVSVEGCSCRQLGPIARQIGGFLGVGSDGPAIPGRLLIPAAGRGASQRLQESDHRGLVCGRQGSVSILRLLAFAAVPQDRLVEAARAAVVQVGVVRRAGLLL